MPARLSIIVPTLNAAPGLPATLGHLHEGQGRNLIAEIIISDGGSTDETCDIARRIGVKVVNGPAGRGGQLARGAEHACGEWLLFLHADTHLLAGWAGAVADHINTSPDAGYFALRFRADGLAPRMVAGWANLRSRLGLPYGDQGLLISASVYREVDGHADIPLMEDVAIAHQLRGRLRALPAIAATDASRYLREGWVKRSLRNAWTLGRYLLGVSPDRLIRGYTGPDSSEN